MGDKEKMKCSIIIPIYKGNKYIKKLVDMLQQWSNSDDIRLEIIFVNDFPEQPVKLPRWKEQSKISIHVINNQRNMGIHYSRIIGTQYATGEYVVFLDQDDTLNENYLISQLHHIKDREAVICNGLYRNGEKIFSLSNPMKKEYSFNEYLDHGYPLVSLGQLLIRRDSIPQEWLNNLMVHNGWDDHFLWALMMAHNVKVSINEDNLYLHEEDGTNASFNWQRMCLSGQNFRDIFLKLNLMDAIQEKQFRYMTDSKIMKYNDYAELKKLLNKVTSNQLEQYFYMKNIHDIAIYGFGVYGKQLYEIMGKTGVAVEYCIDKRNDIKNADIPIISLHDSMRRVDAVVVSPVNTFEEIKNNIGQYCSFKVFSLLDILREVNTIR